MLPWLFLSLELEQRSSDDIHRVFMCSTALDLDFEVRRSVWEFSESSKLNMFSLAMKPFLAVVPWQPAKSASISSPRWFLGLAALHQPKNAGESCQIIIKHTLDDGYVSGLWRVLIPKNSFFWHLIWWREYQQERTFLLSAQRLYSRSPPSKQRQLRDKKCSWWLVWVSPQNSTTISGMGRGSYIANCWDTGLN